MGNEAATTQQKLNNRRRSLPNRNNEDPPPSNYSRPNYNQNHNTINHSLEVPPPSAAASRYHSIDLESADEDRRSIKSDRFRRKEEMEQNRALQKLSKKNEELRNQLKTISEELTQQIKKKRFIPKKKNKDGEQDEAEGKQQVNAGVRRQLENGYRQIQMYKRTIQTLRGKNEEDQSDFTIKRLENLVASTDQDINLVIRKVQGLKKIKKGQDQGIEKDINEDLKGGVVTMKKELEATKKILKEAVKRERLREVNYKRQQAYLFEVQKKYRELNGDYYPQLKKKAYQGNPNPINSRVVKHSGDSKFSIDDYIVLQQELSKLKQVHEEYNKRIGGKVIQKNKLIEEQSNMDQNIKYSDKVIETLKNKIKELKKIFKPTKKSLFGYDSYTGGELQSEYNGGVDEVEKEIEEQNYQDQFDIKHLIANIPRPVKPKNVVEFQDNGKGKDSKDKQPLPRELSADKRGMVVSGEKSEPKKWGSALTREEEKGRGIKKEVSFNDVNNVPVDSKPLIIGINMWVNKNNSILGLQAIYLIKDEIRYGSKSSEAVDGFLQRYDLQSPDYLKNITGAFSSEGYLEYMVLHSKQGKINTFGYKAEGQEQFNYGLASSERPFRLFGASFVFESQPRINRLGLEICEEE